MENSVEKCRLFQMIKVAFGRINISFLSVLLTLGRVATGESDHKYKAIFKLTS
jgi:hypothetical protein